MPETRMHREFLAWLSSPWKPKDGYDWDNFYWCSLDVFHLQIRAAGREGKGGMVQGDEKGLRCEGGISFLQKWVPRPHQCHASPELTQMRDISQVYPRPSNQKAGVLGLGICLSNSSRVWCMLRTHRCGPTLWRWWGFCYFPHCWNKSYKSTPVILIFLWWCLQDVLF